MSGLLESIARRRRASASSRLGPPPQNGSWREDGTLPRGANVHVAAPPEPAPPKPAAAPPSVATEPAPAPAIEPSTGATAEFEARAASELAAFAATEMETAVTESELAAFAATEIEAAVIESELAAFAATEIEAAVIESELAAFAATEIEAAVTEAASTESFAGTGGTAEFEAHAASELAAFAAAQVESAVAESERTAEFELEPEPGPEAGLEPEPEPEAKVEQPAPEEPTARPGLAERGRMRHRVRYLRQLREVQLRDIGGFMLELHRLGRERPDLVRNKLESAASMDGELRALEQALDGRSSLRELREAGIGGACEECGAVHGSADRFCATCGAVLGITPDDDPEAFDDSPL